MKIIVFGANGQLGSALLARKSATFRTKGFSHDEVDVTDEKKVSRILRSLQPDAVINTTAMHAPLACEHDPGEAFAVNAKAVGCMSNVAHDIGATFVTISTDYVFDGSKKTPYTESDTPRPVNVYGLSKYAGELIALWNPQTYVIRTSGLYGGKTGSREKGGNFILTILKQSKDQRSLEVSSEQRVNITYAPDLADATLKLLTAHAPFGVYHITNSGSATWAEIAQHVVILSGRSCRIVPVNRKGESGGVRRPLYSVLSTRKLLRLSITMPQWTDALKRYIQTLPV